jgi:lantibiotic modifying enzyme
MSGAAGAIACLLSLYRTTGHVPALTTASACGQWLVANRPHLAEQALTGFSHGAAGIAWALLALASATSESRFCDEAVRAMAYERRQFSSQDGNWPDLRQLDNANGLGGERQRNFMCAWCHGAPGIGLARIRSLPHMDDAEIRSEIKVALETTLAQGFGSNHSLCHGDLGNLELLFEAGRWLADDEWTRRSQRISAEILSSIEQNGWQCGVPRGVETPGFMTGLAGIGYGLLRASAPEQIPSVLTLEPPIRKI